jgi:hypothetical protein
MKPDPRFVGLPKEFWANVRTISQKVGYTVKQRRKRSVVDESKHTSQVKIPGLHEIADAFAALDLDLSHLMSANTKPTLLGRRILRYFEFRADVLNRVVEPALMNAAQAECLFENVRRETGGGTAIPMNKQSKEKKKPAYFTAIINMLIETNLSGLPCNYNPQALTTVTHNRQPFRTLARRIDGAFPGPVDPIAVWEIKEYYYTTTFGSRVADGVYETLLDGMELEELDDALKSPSARRRGERHIQHFLMIDAYDTWWLKGKSYLCRIIDMLHMGYVDEVLFGREVANRLPVIAREWATKYRRYRP